MKKVLLFVGLITLFISSCKEDEPVNATEVSGPYTKDFETVWENFDQNYVFFDYKSVDWNAQHDLYYPEARIVTDYTDFINILRSMLIPLHDLHVWIKKNNGQFIQPYFPSYFVNWDKPTWNNMLTHYNWHQVGSSWGWFKSDSIGYFAISSWNKDGISLMDFDAALDSMQNCKGIIIDIRMNGGGYGPLAGDIGTRFSPDTFRCGYLKVRNGISHTDFTKLSPIEYYKKVNSRFAKTIILLIGRGCFSTSEIFAAGMTKLPNCITIGDTTGGGLSNSRQFVLTDGTTYSISDQLIYDTEMNIVENKGVAPQITIPYNAQHKTNGIDPVFNYALEILK